jgi:hypothetical protein
MPVHVGIDVHRCGVPYRRELRDRQHHRKRSQVAADDAVARYSPTAARRIRLLCTGTISSVRSVGSTQIWLIWRIRPELCVIYREGGILTCPLLAPADLRWALASSSHPASSWAVADRATVPATGLLVMIGAENRIGWFRASIGRDELGFIRTGRDLHRPASSRSADRSNGRRCCSRRASPACSRPGTCGTVHQRVISAAGEGVTVIQLIHEYLRTGQD